MTTRSARVDAETTTSDPSARGQKDAGTQRQYGSDFIVDRLADLGVEYVSLNPGASLRGLHDSLVNSQRPDVPKLILCAHEEIVVAIAHGYAKASGRQMASMIHNIVGLQHASMAIFNAWVDRVPMLLVGGGGPMDAEHRRPRIDWNHTALVQGNLIRDYVKWDDQPTSLGAASEALIRGAMIAEAQPQGPVYVCIDTDLQEVEIAPDLGSSRVKDFNQPAPIQAPSDLIDAVVDALVGARNPLLVVDHTGRHEGAVALLHELTDRLAVPVIDVGNRFNVATTHPMNLTGAEEECLAVADVLLALDVKDLYGAVTVTDRSTRESKVVLNPAARTIAVGIDHLLSSGFVADYQRLQPVSLNITADTAVFLPELVKRLGTALTQDRADEQQLGERRARIASRHEELREGWRQRARRGWDDEPISVPRLASDLWSVLEGEEWVIANGNLAGWVKRLWDIERPRQYLGPSGGGGLGYGYGASLGAALALKDSGAITLNLQGDGDFMYTPNALWTAAHHKIPVFTVLFNNRSYFTDEIHQELIAETRGRPVENKTIGIRIEDPAIDYAKMAESMGVKGFGPVTSPSDLRPTLDAALAYVKSERLPVLVDVVTQPR